MKPLTAYRSPYTDPCRNLALEDYLFASLPPGEEALFLWQNRPSVILGIFQNAPAEVDLEEAERRRVPVVRRLSGGGAVYHDLGNLNYSLILDCEDPEKASLEAFALPAVRACRSLGAEVFFGGRNDIFAGEKKLSGSAQYFRDGRLLHHGCVMISTDLSVIPAVLRPKSGRIPAGAESSLVRPVTTLSLVLGRPVTAAEFSKAFIEESGGKEAACGQSFWREEELDGLQKRYEDPRWTFGYPPSYEETREERFAGGFVRIHLRMKEGRIGDIAFSGDFFCTGDLEDLCGRLRGCSFGEDLLTLLQSSEADCIRGVTPRQLYGLITG